MTTRRGFFGLVLGAAVAPALAPLLKYIPKTKTTPYPSVWPTLTPVNYQYRFEFVNSLTRKRKDVTPFFSGNRMQIPLIYRNEANT